MSEKSTAQKLFIRPGARVWSSHPDRLAVVGPLPDDVAIVDEPAGATALVFADDAVYLRAILDASAAGLQAAATLWIAYPKANRTDINRDSLWPILAEHGWRPIGQVAIDETWSALRFRPLAAGEAPFTGGR